jgi:hypothetical protein
MLLGRAERKAVPLDIERTPRTTAHLSTNLLEFK